MKLVRESIDEGKSEFEKKRRYDRMPDITRTDRNKSVAARFEPLIVSATQYRKNPQELKNLIINILEDPDTDVSLETMRKYKADLGKLHTFEKLIQFVTNIYLAGAKMKVSAGKMPLL